MDDLAFGRLIRMARIERRWRQVDLDLRADVSAARVSRVERGHLSQIPLGTIRATAEVLGVRVQLLGRARAVDLDRVANAPYSGLAGFAGPTAVRLPRESRRAA
ncbi:MAG: helix-turn-helix transcriptional regulator [Chloroflexi bacterium]|nr:helix-turn-helix transcriptional regulator [Chloroflexota bacterium]